MRKKKGKIQSKCMWSNILKYFGCPIFQRFCVCLQLRFVWCNWCQHVQYRISWKPLIASALPLTPDIWLMLFPHVQVDKEERSCSVEAEGQTEATHGAPAPRQWSERGENCSALEIWFFSFLMAWKIAVHICSSLRVFNTKEAADQKYLIFLL